MGLSIVSQAPPRSTLPSRPGPLVGVSTTSRRRRQRVAPRYSGRPAHPTRACPVEYKHGRVAERPSRDTASVEASPSAHVRKSAVFTAERGHEMLEAARHTQTAPGTWAPRSIALINGEHDGRARVEGRHTVTPSRRVDRPRARRWPLQAPHACCRRAAPRRHGDVGRPCAQPRRRHHRARKAVATSTTERPHRDYSAAPAQLTTGAHTAPHVRDRYSRAAHVEHIQIVVRNGRLSR